MKILLISVVISLSLCQLASTQCTFPASLQDVWESPVKGNMTFNSTYLTGYDIYTYTDLEFECHNTSDDNYIVRSGDLIILGNSVNAVMCLKFSKVSSNKYTYFILTSKLADANYERVKFIQNTDSITDLSTVCDDTTVADNPQETKLLIKYGTADTETVRCPNVILGKYYDYNNTCNTTYWDVCSNLKQMSFDPNCTTQRAFSENGTVNCVYTVKTGDESLVYVYNLDGNTDESTTYRFTCMVIKKDKKRVDLTEHPQECYTNQTSTYVPSPGIVVELEAEKTCVPSSSSEAVSQAGLVAGLVILALVLVAAIGAGVGYYIYTKKFKKVDPNDKRIIDKETQEHRVTDAVTPSVVQADIKSPKTNGSHGTRRKKKIGVKKVSGPVVPLPPVDTIITPHKRRRKIENMSLITPSTLRESFHLKPLTLKQNGTHKPNLQDDSQAPKVETAPPLLQLPLPREETFTAMSRCSTIFEDKIGIEMVPQTPKPSVPPTPKTPRKRTKPRPSITRQSNRSRKSVATPVSRQSRRQPTLSVKSLDKSKNKYVKYAKAVFKDAGVVYKRKIRLVGKVQKRKSSSSNRPIKLNNVTKAKIEKPDSEKPDKNIIKAPENAIYAFDTVKELRRPPVKIEINIPKHEPEIEIIEPPKTNTNKPESPKFIYDDKDNNFFMCSNDEDKEYKEFMEKRKQEHEAEMKLNNSIRSKDRLSTRVPYVNKRSKTDKNKSSDKPNKTSILANLFQNVEKVARFSALRKKLVKKGQSSKEAKEAHVEQNVLNRVHYNDSTSKIQHRRRLQRAVNVSRNFERLPTLLNWVECTDILSTPAMRMQNKLTYDTVKNERFLSRRQGGA